MTQWKDVHNLIVACYEALTREAVMEHTNPGRENTSDKFWQWLDDTESNGDAQTYAYKYVLFFLQYTSG